MTPPIRVSITLTNPGLNFEPGLAVLEKLQELVEEPLEQIMFRKCTESGTDGTSFDLGWYVYTSEEAETYIQVVTQWASANGWRIAEASSVDG